MDSLIILIVTGIYLTFFYVPSSTDVIYAPTSGHVYTPLLGQHMTEAYRSVINISFDTRIRLDHAPGPPLGRPHLPGCGAVPHVPRLLHRRLPQAPGDQLDHRPDPVDGRDAGGVHRLLPARRSPVRNGAPGHLLDHRRHPVRRHLAGFQHLGWRLPGHVLHSPSVRHPRVSLPGHHRRAPDRPFNDFVASETHRLPGCGQDGDQHPGQPDMAAVRHESHRAVHDRQRGDLPLRRSVPDQPGLAVRPLHPLHGVHRDPNPTGTSDGSTGLSGSGRTGSSDRSATRSPTRSSRAC